MRELTKILKFLQFPVELIEDRLSCLQKHLEGSFNRGQPKV